MSSLEIIKSKFDMAGKTNKLKLGLIFAFLFRASLKLSSDFSSKKLKLHEVNS